MAMSAEHRSKFATLHRQPWRMQMSEKFLSGTKNSKQTKGTLDYVEITLLVCVNTVLLLLFGLLVFKLNV